jgi:cell division protein FtsI (penicillin-binding protein 3)
MKARSSQRFLKLRINLIMFFFIGIFSIIMLRSYQLQIIEKERCIALLHKQYRKYVTLPPKRGTIYDREKRELAVSLDVDSVYVRPSEVRDAKAMAQQLSPILKSSGQFLLGKITSDRPFVWLMRRITPAQAQEIQSLHLEGIGFSEESRRFYPNKELASNCLGFTGVDPKGLEGIERSYDSYLNGKPGSILLYRDAKGRSIYSTSIMQEDATKGYNLQLTIDQTIQHVTEKALEEGIKKSRAKAGTAIVMAPHTGEILAMAVRPTYNPNSFGDYQPHQRRNRAVTDAFEPGSTFKAFLASSALEEKTTRPQDVFFCENGSYPFGGRIIHDVHKYGPLTMAEVIKYSSNIGACKIAQTLGDRKFYSYIKKFGFGSKTGIDLPGENSGLLAPPDQWSRISLGTIAFGQGLSISPIQLITALSAIANDGMMMKPHLVKTIFDDQETIIKEIRPESLGRVVSADTARQVASILKSVVEEGGTGTQAFIDGYSVAGKTGTAQKVDRETRRYSDHKMASSFMGFFPAEKPQVAILVVIDEPEGVKYGGVVAAPVFKEIAQTLISYLNIAPVTGRLALAKNPSPAASTGNQTFINPVSYQEVSLSGSVMGDTIPDFTGMSMKTALALADKCAITVELSGSGMAIDQSPPPGGSINTKRKCWIRFQPPVS